MTSRVPHLGGSARAIIALVLAAAFWAGNYAVGQIAVKQIDPLSLTLERWALAVIPLVVIAQLVERPDWRQVLRHLPFLVAQALLGLAGYNMFLYSALQHTDAFHASLINAANPALIVLAAAAVMRQRLKTRDILGVLVAFFGVLIVLTDGDLTRLGASSFGVGDLLMLGAITVWAAYTVMGRRGPKLPPIASTAVQAAVVVVLLTPVLAVRGGTLPADGAGWWSLIFIAVFPSVLSYVLWNSALQVVEPARAGVFLNLITVFTALFAVLWGSGITWTQVLGGFVVIGGVIIANADALRPRRPVIPLD